MKTRTETFRCYLKIMSPVHIGCDEVYEPTSFVVDETDKSGPKMIVFDPLEFISGLDEGERKRFSEICKKGSVVSILELYKFLRGKKAVGKKVSLCSGFLNNYNRVLGLQNNERDITQNLNKFEVKRTAFRLYDERPYIPGSSIKGSLRTAYLNYLNASQIQKTVGSIKEIEKILGATTDRTTDKLLTKYEASMQSRLLGFDFNNKNEGPFDPFKLIKISDFQPVGDVRTKIIYSNNKNKNPDKQETEMAQLLEVIEPGAVFVGDINVEMPISKDSNIKSAITKDELLNACNHFFKTELDREAKILAKYKFQSSNSDFQQNAIPIRIGKHSGAESVTVNGYRAIKIKQKKSNKYIYMNHATCIRVASETKDSKKSNYFKPFGWSAIIELTPEKEKEFSNDELVFRNEFERKESERLDAAEIVREEALKRLEEKKRREEEARLRKIEEEQKAKEAEERKVALESMSPVDRYVAQLADLSFSEQDALKIYDDLQKFEGEEQKKVALALKIFWISKDKWKEKGKAKQDKQFKKVLKIKEILGEA